MKPYYSQDGIDLYHGDCREVLPQLAPGSVDLVLTDPPYGLGDGWSGGNWQADGVGRGRIWTGKIPEWDLEPPTIEELMASAGVGKNAIIWGGNYFGLPASRGWLVWDKCANIVQSQAELAWSNLPICCRVFRLSPLGVWGNGGKNGERKLHPSQKPLALIAWCLSLVPDCETILDPYCGSGTTLRAAKDLGRKAIGIEVCEKYCEIAVRRLSQGVLPYA